MTFVPDHVFSPDLVNTGASGPLVLVTGATGRIGRVVVRHLIEGGYRVRATTSGAQLPADADDGSVAWRHLDLRYPSSGLSDLVPGCAAVIHLAAAMTEVADMRAVNVDGTRALAVAAESAAVPVFIYASSVAVYGSPSSRYVTEDTPVLTAQRDVRSEYWAVDQLRTYGRTKLGGELAIRDVAVSTRYVIFRPTVVVDIDDLLAIGDWPRSKRDIAAHRHAHHVYVGDVADAFRWAVARGLAGIVPPGSIEVFNLGDEDCEAPTHADFLKRAHAVSKDNRFRTRQLPFIVDWARDFARFRSFPLRNPLWRMRFAGDRLRDAGWRPAVGMSKVQAEALSRLSSRS